MQDYLIECRRLRKENESLRMRIAELESVQQWHPASEPPENHGAVLLKRKTFAQRGHEWNEYVYYEAFDYDGEWPCGTIAWHSICDSALPPLPESRHDQ